VITRHFPVVLASLFLGFLPLPHRAQDEPDTASAAATEAEPDAEASDQSGETAEPKDGAPAEIPLGTLRARLVPLTAEELEREARTWRDRVKAKATQVAEAKNAAEPDGPLIDELLREQNQLIERLRLVLDAWEAKGGDPASYRAYATAVRGAEMSPDDPSSFLLVFTRWVRSEDGALKLGKNLIGFLIIVAIGAVLASIASKLIAKAMGRSRRSSGLLTRFVSVVVKRLILAIGIVVGLSTIGVNVGALVAVIGGGAFILGFALQDTLANFANGVMLMVYRPFDVGDAVEVGGISGSVDSVSLVNTHIRSWDNKIIIVPNKSVWGQVITNITGADRRRVDMNFGIGYGDDSEKAQSILETILAEHELVLDDPAPVVRLNELGASSVNFVCRPWAKTADYWSVYWDVTKRVKSEFDAQGISIPFPQQDVHLHRAN
jgi:small conductance mechanosensitive channel